MTGKLYIDNKDAYSGYGIRVTNGGYKELLTFAPLKPVESNDWAEEDGAEFDLSSPVLDTRELSIQFAFDGDNKLFEAFIELLSDGAYHDFNFTEIGRTYRLRLVSQASIKQISTLGAFSLRFADDFPLSGYRYTEPQSGLVPQRGYELDGRDFSEYGIYILKGSDTEIQKLPAAKKNLLQSVDNKNGAIYDGGLVVFQTKEVKLNCLMRAATLSEFWRNYNAFLFDLVRPGERGLYTDSDGNEYSCYYKNCSVSGFEPGGKVLFQFSITLVFTCFRIGGEEFLLASEGEQLITTEQDNYTINLLTHGN